MIIERLIYNKSGYFYGLYTLVRVRHSYKWVYVSDSMALDKDKRQQYISIYIDEPDGAFISFKESHLDGN